MEKKYKYFIYMKLFLRTVLFHFICIIFFAIMYYNYRDQLQHRYNEEFSVYDYILLSTTIQAGVGISSIFPVTTFTKSIMITQHLLLIMTHVFTIYIFNI